MLHPRRLGRDVDALRLVDLLGLGLLQVVGGKLHLDDMRAEQRRDMRGIGADVDGGLAVLGQIASPRG
jgi:hypothetical protein